MQQLTHGGGGGRKRQSVVKRMGWVNGHDVMGTRQVGDHSRQRGHNTGLEACESTEGRLMQRLAKTPAFC